eukprot:NODE_571_length_5897_cov_0.529148.p3 type:complete len:185 gc:universal NODE_571_length_5897_cov_0.529148:5569-5015(-)
MSSQFSVKSSDAPNVQMLTFCFTLFALVDCDNLLNFAISLGMQQANPTVFSQIQNNCCTGSISGIICNSNAITYIHWEGMALSGIFEGQYIPRGVVDLSIHGNRVTGNVTNLPDSLQKLDLSNNRLDGYIDRFPNALTRSYPKQFDKCSNLCQFRLHPDQWQSYKSSIVKFHQNIVYFIYSSNR